MAGYTSTEPENRNENYFCGDMDVFTSKGKPIEFYVFPGSYRDFLIFLIQSAGGKISSSLSAKTVNIAGRFSDIPPGVKFDVLGVDYITTSLKMKCAIYPANFVLSESYNYAPSLIQDFKSYLGSFRKKSSGKSHTNNVYREHEEESRTRIHKTYGERSSRMNSPDITTDVSRIARGDCVVQTTSRSDNDMRSSTEMGSQVKHQPCVKRERDIPIHGARIISRKTEREKNDRTRDKASCSSSGTDCSNGSSHFKRNTQQKKVSRDLDTLRRQSSNTIKESAQTPIVIDLTKSRSSESLSDGSVHEGQPPRPARREEQLPSDNDEHVVLVSMSDMGFLEKYTLYYKSVFYVRKQARSPYSRQEKNLIVSFIKDHDLYSYVKGTYMWKYMEKKNVVSGRGWKSMAGLFRKNILPNIERFGDILSQKEITNFKRILDPNYENTDTTANSRGKKLETYFRKGSKPKKPRRNETGGGETSAPTASLDNRCSNSPAKRHCPESSHYNSSGSEPPSGFGSYLEHLVQE